MTWRDLLTDARMFDREGRRDRPELWSATSRRGVVTSAHYRATRAGVEVLDRGGNAIDAAVATSLALSVCESAGSGLGGMAMMIVHIAASGRTFVIEGACRAPARATPDRCRGEARRLGYTAVAVPVYLAVLEHALARYGTLSQQAVLEAAIVLAREGFPLTALQSKLMEESRVSIARFSAARFFLNEDGTVPPPGTIFRQPALANTLERLHAAGFRDFYEGEIADRYGRDFEENGGFIRADDLAAVKAPNEVEPLRGQFRGAAVYTAGRPAGGAALLQMLHVFEAAAKDTADPDPDSPEGAVLLAEIIRRARSDRREFRFHRPEDPDLTSADYARSLAAQMWPQDEDDGEEPAGEAETSHLSVIDAEGNAVGLTQSIERSFGAKIVTSDLGFLHNGYMKGFKVKTRAHPHYLKPGAVARSNAAPTVVVEDGVPRAVLGSTGSERMCSGIFEVIIRLSRAQSPFEAVHAPRLHCTPEGLVLIEAPRVARGVLERLESRGFRIEAHDPYAFKFGGLHLAAARADTRTGVAEPRRDGAAAGPD